MGYNFELSQQISFQSPSWRGRIVRNIGNFTLGFGIGMASSECKQIGGLENIAPGLGILADGAVIAARGIYNAKRHNLTLNSGFAKGVESDVMLGLGTITGYYTRELKEIILPLIDKFT